MNHVFHSMGTAISLAGDVSDADARAIEQAFAELDARFSLYREDSELSRLARRDILLPAASPQVRTAYELAAFWRSETEGAFTPHRPDGVIDLAGVVKAMAIQVAGDILDASGSQHWCVNAGGDILTRTGHERDPWVIGVTDPSDRQQLLTQFTASHAFPAFATSGIAERGEHIWRLGADDTFISVSVAGPDIVTVDVLATAILAGGPATLERALQRWPLEVIASTRSGEYVVTAAFLDPAA